MKIVHISTLEDGGAGIATIRLHEGLIKKGIDSTFLCAIAKGHSALTRVAEEPDPTLLQRIALRAGVTVFDTVEHERKKIKSCRGDYEYYSLPISRYRLEENEHVLSADVIHFHWVSNFVNFPTFFTLKKPVVWTFHDMNPLLGGFHYSADLLKNMENAELMRIERRYKQIKADATAKANLNICAPSRWLYEVSLADETMGRFPHHHIPNGLDTEVFTPYPQDMARQVFGLPLKKKIFVFVSANIANKRKGFHLLEEAVAGIPPEADFLVVALGYNHLAAKDPRIVFLEPIHDEPLLPLLFSAADVCVIPSVEDNLPNVMLESLSCGAPVLGFPIGGLKDTIRDGVDGFLCPAVSAEALAATMIRALGASLDRAEIRESAKKFDESVQASSYLAIYNSIS